MLRQDIKYGNDINLYLNGIGHSYQFFHKTTSNHHSFLIPRTHYNLFTKDLEQKDLSVSFKSEGKFYIFDEIIQIKKLILNLF